MPIWADVVLALVAGFLSGLGATLLQNRHAGAVDMRGRMLTAADEFLGVSVRALIDLRRAQLPVLSGGTVGRIVGQKEPEQALADLHGEVVELELLLARLQLVYGSTSATAELARAIAARIRDATNVLEYATQALLAASEQRMGEIFGGHYRAAHEANNRFAAEARRDLPNGGLSLRRFSMRLRREPTGSRRGE